MTIQVATAIFNVKIKHYSLFVILWKDRLILITYYIFCSIVYLLIDCQENLLVSFMPNWFFSWFPVVIYTFHDGHIYQKGKNLNTTCWDFDVSAATKTAHTWWYPHLKILKENIVLVFIQVRTPTSFDPKIHHVSFKHLTPNSFELLFSLILFYNYVIRYDIVF